MADPYRLTITPPTLSGIPSDETLLNAGRELIESTKSWKQGKTYDKGRVKTFSRPKGPEDGAAWHLRLSVHGPEDATFDEFWSKLGVDKAENEKSFIPDIHKVTLVKRISPTQVLWTIQYVFPPPVSPRIFTVLQTTHLDTTSAARAGYVISIPVDLTSDPADSEFAKLEEKGVKGRYVSVERILELEGGKVEWRMATSSSPGGNIPQFVAEMTMASKISEDVPHFIKWFHTVRSQPNAEQVGEAAANTA
ncbi:hypothetical protein BD410DRAFT_894523 [Rickenella mellea]|uniref:DUF3074 domain-containing protein n=1 Tax=Rickenella mellea TaxID=50990 RepID=A0A4Y7QJY9_9AGAM|nr:hypothetical protein BD410DRAFT_894523 [Rickenella mellea]